MLDNLLEIEIAYNLLKVGDDKGRDPIDLHYEKLKTDIQVPLAFFLLYQGSFTVCCLISFYEYFCY